MTTISQALQQNNGFLYLLNEEIGQVANNCEWMFTEYQPINAPYILLKVKVKIIFDSKKIIEVDSNEESGDWAVINDTVQLATAKAINPIEFLAINANKSKGPAFSPQETMPKISVQFTKSIIQQLQSQSQVSSKFLLDLGETETIEFKSSLRKNLHTYQKDHSIELAIIKTIAGFLNCHCCDFFAGVDDQGDILDLESDGFQNNDKLLLHLEHLSHEKNGRLADVNVLYSTFRIDGKKVVRVNCGKSQSPFLLKNELQQHFHVHNDVETISNKLKRPQTK